MALVDQFGREIGNVRISLTDRCDLRCQYCMPEEGIEWSEKSELLTFEEILRIINIFHEQGVRKFRLTGGEPLLRKGLVDLISQISTSFPDIELSMTTNGVRLSNIAAQLSSAGLDRINISLDTLDPDAYHEITRRDSLDKVLMGIKEAINHNIEVKVNAVSIKSFNDDLKSLISFVELSENHNIEVRFIELMPFTGNNWKNGGFISSKTLRDRINREERLVPLPMNDKSSTSKSWSLRDGNAKIGFISSVTESFCSSCNRLRITAEGKLRPCLHNSKEYDLKSILRTQKDDRKILELIQLAINNKWKGHPDFLSLNFENPIDDREMIRIGG